MLAEASAQINGSVTRAPRVSYLMKEIPAVTGRGLSTAYRDAKLGRLKVRKSGRSSIVLADDLMAWLGAEPSNS